MILFVKLRVATTIRQINRGKKGKNAAEKEPISNLWISDPTTRLKKERAGNGVKGKNPRARLEVLNCLKIAVY